MTLGEACYQLILVHVIHDGDLFFVFTRNEMKSFSLSVCMCVCIRTDWSVDVDQRWPLSAGVVSRFDCTTRRLRLGRAFAELHGPHQCAVSRDGVRDARRRARNQRQRVRSSVRVGPRRRRRCGIARRAQQADRGRRRVSARRSHSHRDRFGRWNNKNVC